MRKGLLVTLVLAGLVLGAGAGVYVGLPTLAERFSQRILAKVATHFGRELSVTGITFHRYDRIELSGVEVRRPGAPASEQPLFAAEHVDVRFDPDSVLTGKVRLERVELTNPRLGVIRYADGSDNYDDVVEKIRRILRRDRSGGGEGEGPFSYLARAMPELVVRGGQVRVEDQTGKLPVPGIKVIELTDGTLSARDESVVADQIRLVFSGHIGVPLLDNSVGFSGHFNYPQKTYDFAVSLDRRLEHNLAGRDVSVGGLSWDMGGRLKLTDVVVGGAPGSAEARTGRPALRIKSVDLTLGEDTGEALAIEGLPAAMGGRIGKILKRIRKVTLVEPELSVARYKDSRTSFADLGAHLQAAPVVMPGGSEGVATPGAELPVGDRKARIAAQESERTRSRERRAKMPGEGVRLGVSGFLGTLESSFRRLSDVVFLVGARMPVPEIAISGGTLRYADELLFEEGFQSELYNFDMTARRAPGEPVMTFDVRFETGERSRAANQVTGRIHLVTRDVQVGVSIERLGLLPYKALFPDKLPVDSSSVVHHTNVQFVYSHERDAMQVEGTVRVDGLGFFHPRVATEVLSGMDIGAEFHANMDFSNSLLQIDRAVLALSGARMQATGRVEQYATYPKFDLQLRMPKAPVQVLADSLPLELVPMLEGLRVGGNLTYSLDVRLDTKDIETLDYDSDYKLDDFFVVDLGKRLNFDLLRGKFIHRVHEPDGTIREFMTGPGAPSWVSYDSISPYMTAVITTTEDGSFFTHSGFSTLQIKKSIITNLQKGGFYRGASTISQQLVKNLFLSREKTISRKLQELFITWQLEKTLSKEEILALYFNVIEFGPGIYGIRGAARHYFDKSPSELSVLDCAFLASIIPNPKKYHSQFEAGEVSESWRKKLEYYLRKMVERGKITELEFALARPFSPAFAGQPEPARPSQLIGSQGQLLTPEGDGLLEAPSIFDPEAFDDEDGDIEGGAAAPTVSDPPVIPLAPPVLPTKPSMKPRGAHTEP